MSFLCKHLNLTKVKANYNCQHFHAVISFNESVHYEEGQHFHYIVIHTMVNRQVGRKPDSLDLSLLPTCIISFDYSE